MILRGHLGPPGVVDKDIHPTERLRRAAGLYRLVWNAQHDRARNERFFLEETGEDLPVSELEDTTLRVGLKLAVNEATAGLFAVRHTVAILSDRLATYGDGIDAAVAVYQAVEEAIEAGQTVRFGVPAA